MLALAVAISSFVALSLVPAMASRLPATQAPAGFFARLQALGDSLVDAYARLLAVVLRYPVRVLSLAALLALAAGSLYQLLDKELLPPEDRGQIRIFATGPNGVGVPYM